MNCDGSITTTVIHSHVFGLFYQTSTRSPRCFHATSPTLLVKKTAFRHVAFPIRKLFPVNKSRLAKHQTTLTDDIMHCQRFFFSIVTEPETFSELNDRPQKGN